MDRLYTSSLVIHHSVTPQKWSEKKTVDLIQRSHKQRGLAYDGLIAYHYLFGKDWTYVGRPAQSVGYHSGSWLTNQTSIALCLVGNFNVDTPTPWQEGELKKYLGLYRHLTIKLHREVKSTACPGLNLTRAYLGSLLTISDLRIRELFQAIWGKEPAPGDWQYFRVRLDQGSITDENDLARKLAFWYGVVYPNRQFSTARNERWQQEKAKWQRNQ